MIKERQITQKNNAHIAPSADQWVVATAEITRTVEISLLHQSGHYFQHKQSLGTTRLDLLEYGQDEPHNHNLGGDVKMHACEIADKFYSDSNIEDIYVYTEDKEVDLFLVLAEEVSMMSLRLAKLQRRIAKQHPNIEIEIIYTTKEHFTTDKLPDGAELYPRRK